MICPNDVIVLALATVAGLRPPPFRTTMVSGNTADIYFSLIPTIPHQKGFNIPYISKLLLQVFGK